MELSFELYLRRYWKVEEILLLLFEGCESAEFGKGFYVEGDRTIYKAELEEAISKAIKSGDLEEHKALDDDNSDYLDRYEFSNWLAHKHEIDINRYLLGGPPQAIFYDGPDRTVFSRAAHDGGLFTLEQAFRHLVGIPTTCKKIAHWSNEDRAKFEAFKVAANGKKEFTPQETIATAKKADICITEEILIIIEEAERFGTHDQKKTAKNWHDITLTLLANNRIECSFDNTKFKESLEYIGLAKQGNRELTKPGGVLLGLSNQLKYPINKSPDDSERTDIGKIRAALRELRLESCAA